MELAAAIEQIINARVEWWRAMRAGTGTYHLTEVGFVGGGFIGQTQSNDLARDPAVRRALDELSTNEDKVIVWHR
jgi:outer membrane lipoprotein SlyB